MNTAIQPAVRPDYSPEQRDAWMQRHEEFVARASPGNIDLVFLGDSLTDHWRDAGRAEWDRCFKPLNAANFGISGDRTQQVLWRITHGELNGILPRGIVLLIGTNNLTPGLGENSLTRKNTPDEVIAGVDAIVRELRRRLPSARILLHALLPRGEPLAPIRREVTATNAGLSRLADGDVVRFVDLGGHFLRRDDTILQELMPDLLHPNSRGYAVWASALSGPVTGLLA